MGKVKFKVENNIPKYRRQTQYLKKVKSFVDESASENDGLFTTEDIIENGWSNEIKEEKSEIEKLPKLVESDETLISLRCFKTMIEIYSDQNNFSDIIKLKGEDDEPKNVKGIVKDFWDNNEELARELFKPIWDAYNSTDKTEKSEKIALEKFNKQAETISLISKYMPTTEKLEKMLKNSNPAELSKQLKNFDNLTLQDYFMPPMILSLMFVDPVLSSEKVKEEIYEVLPEDTVVTSELIEEKKEYLSKKAKEEENNTKIFKQVNEEVDAWINRSQQKNGTSCDETYEKELQSLTKNFSLGGDKIHVNDNEETAHKFYSLVNGELSSKLDKIPEVKMRWYDNFKRSSDYIDKHIRSQVSSFVKSLKSNSSKISSLKNGDQEGTENKLSDDDISRLIRYIIYDYNELIEKIISAGLDTNDIMINTLVKYIGNFLVSFKMDNKSVSLPEKPKLKFKKPDSISSSNENNDYTDDDNEDDNLNDIEDFDEDDDLDDIEDLDDDDFDDIFESDDIPDKNNDKDRDRKFGSQKIKIKNYNTNINISNVKNKGVKGNTLQNSGTTINFNFYGNYGMGNGSPMMSPMFNTMMPPMMSPIMMPMINPQLMKLWIQQMSLMYGDFSQFKNGVPAIENYLTEKSDDSPKDTDVDNKQENSSSTKDRDWIILPLEEDDLETSTDENSEASSEICENRWKTGLRPLIRAMMLICIRGKGGRASDNLMQIIKKCNVDIGTGDQQITKNGQNVVQSFDQIHLDSQTYAGAMIMLIENSKKEYFNTKLFSPEQDVKDLEYLLNLIKNLSHNHYIISSKEREHIVGMFNKKEYNPHDRLITKFEDLLSDKSDGNPHILNVLKQNNSNNTSPKTYK